MTLVPPLKYRKKPVVVDAFHYKGYEDFNLLRVFVGGSLPLHDMGDGVIGITTLEGVMEASPGDWIIKGVKGEFYPCKPDIFEATYSPRTDALAAHFVRHAALAALVQECLDGVVGDCTDWNARARKLLAGETPSASATRNAVLEEAVKAAESYYYCYENTEIRTKHGIVDAIRGLKNAAPQADRKDVSGTAERQPEAQSLPCGVGVPQGETMTLKEMRDKNRRPTPRTDAAWVEACEDGGDSADPSILRIRMAEIERELAERPSLATPPENLDVLLARLSDHLSPAEKRELLDAAEELRRFAYLREHWDDFSGTTWREPAKHLDAAIDAAMKRQSEKKEKP